MCVCVNHVDDLLFLVVVGCSDMSMPRGMSFRREHDENVATIECTETDQTWRLQCQAGAWKGVIGNCSSRKYNVDALISVMYMYTVQQYIYVQYIHVA